MKNLYKKLKAKNIMIRMERCKYCHSTQNLTIDHIIPIIQKGTNDYKNLQCLCRDCNMFKSGMSHNQLMNIINWWIKIRPIEKLEKQIKNLKRKY